MDLELTKSVHSGRPEDLVETFRFPDVFVEGVPCRLTEVRRDANGRRRYAAVPIDIPADVPSAYWREGA